MEPLLEVLGLHGIQSEEKAANLQSILQSHPVLSNLLYGLLSILLPLLRGCQAPPLTEGQIEPRFYRHAMQIDGVERTYEVYVTDQYDASTSWPLILFWHGILESGNDGYAHLDVGIGPALRDFPDHYPCIVALPQLPWNPSADESDALFDAVQADVQNRYNIDPDRIYMTGISYGAAGAWHLAAISPGRFAAILPIAGAGNPDEISGLLSVPIWTFASGQDVLSDTQRWRDFVTALENAGANVKATELPGSSHEIWNQVYPNPAVTDWLFSQSLAP